MPVTNTDYGNSAALAQHPRGIQPICTLKDGVTLAQLASAFDMQLSEICELTFGTSDVSEVEEFLKQKHNTSGTELIDGATVWVFVYDTQGVEIPDDYSVTAYMVGDPVYDNGPPMPTTTTPVTTTTVTTTTPPVVTTTTTPVMVTGAIQALNAPLTVNTATLDFKTGDILLTEHPLDCFIQEMTLSWATHAGMVADGGKEEAVDAMPGRDNSAVGIGPIRTAVTGDDDEDIFLDAPSTGACLVYRYKGGGVQAMENARITRQKKARKKKRKKKRGPKPQAMQLPEHPGMTARRAAAWAVAETQKPYKFSLRSNIIGVDSSFFKRSARKSKTGEFVVSDKTFSGKPGKMKATLTNRETGKVRRSTFYKGDYSLFKTKGKAHAMFCSELVWRAFRFGAGVTLVAPKDFFYFYDHPDRAIIGLLQFVEAHDSKLRGLIAYLTHKKSTKAAQKTVIGLLKRRHAGYILAPCQLGQSKFVEEKHKIQATDDRLKETLVADWSKADLHPIKVLEMLSDIATHGDAYERDAKNLVAAAETASTAAEAIGDNYNAKYKAYSDAWDAWNVMPPGTPKDAKWLEVEKLNKEQKALKDQHEKMEQEAEDLEKQAETAQMQILTDFPTYKSKQINKTPKTYSVDKPWDDPWNTK